jgi:tRNA (guanine37-N1)-methyltransferase
MQFGVITLFPEMFTAFSASGITSRAVNKNIVQLSFFNPRDFAQDAHRSVDDRPYGGGPGMVMMPEPLFQAITAAKQVLGADTPVYYLSPQGPVFTQAKAITLSQQVSMILLCGRYEGVDQRLLDHYVDAEISVGDYVVSGGELPAMLVMDAITRLLPGVLGDPQSAVQDSFMQDGQLDCPHYTRPEIWQDLPVPEVLLSGHHVNITRWRAEQAAMKSNKRC